MADISIAASGPRELLEQWLFRVHRMQIAHYEAAQALHQLNLALDSPTIPPRIW